MRRLGTGCSGTEAPADALRQLGVEFPTAPWAACLGARRDLGPLGPRSTVDRVTSDQGQFCRNRRVATGRPNRPMADLSDTLSLLAPAHLSIGDVARLCRVSTTCRLVLAEDASLWAAFSHELGLRRARPRTAVFAMLREQARCRECGARAIPRRGVRVCGPCARDPLGYCAMVDARFIQCMLQSTGDARCFRAVTARARVVRRTTPNAMRVYWRDEALYHARHAASGAAPLLD